MKRMACVIALATGAGLAFGLDVRPAYAGLAAPVVASDLQIAIADDSNFSGDLASIHVNFRGGHPRSVELYVDGTLIRKQALRVKKNAGRITFTLDGLPEGRHEVLVKVTDVHGATATTTARFHVLLDDANAPARFVYPRRNQQVKEIVPLQLHIDPTIRNPYVTYLLDKEFLALINLPPYTYNWDSSRVPNGAHTLTVEIYDAESLALVKTVELPIVVNNPGGFTERQKLPEPVRPDAVGAELTRAIRAAAQATLPAANLDLQQQEARLLRQPNVFTMRPMLRSSAAPSGNLSSRTTSVERPGLAAPHANANLTGTDMRRAGNLPGSLPFQPTLRTGGTPSEHLVGGFERPGLLARDAYSRGNGRDVIAPRTPGLPVGSNLPGTRTALQPELPTMKNRSGIAAPDVRPITPSRVPLPTVSVARPGLMGAVANPTEIASLVVLPASQLARQAVRVARPGNIAARPSLTFSHRNVAQNPQLVSAPKPGSRPVAVASALRVPNGKTFAVSFDSKPIVFDVAPRVENHVPLAPFRPLFAQLGGTVEFAHETKTVLATSPLYQLEFQSGKLQARVNNQTLLLERAPYIEQGRAIVPLSLLRDALNLKVNYDAATGRMIIESNR